MTTKEALRYRRIKEAEQVARAREAALKLGTITEEEARWLLVHESFILPENWKEIK